MALFESSGVGLTYDNINTVYKNYKFSSCLGMMAIAFFLYLFVGLYLDNVLRGDYGLKKPWYFIFQPSYWFGAAATRNRRIHQRDSQSAYDLEKDQDDFESKQMKKENFEPVSREF